jgi:hypothetical protein
MNDRALAVEERARRRRVWSAWSQLFLDTELQAAEHCGIARQLRESGYTDAQLLRILEDEVAPVCGPNLLSMAGEWAGFDEGWLAERIQDQLAARPFWRWLTRSRMAPVLLMVRKDRAAVMGELARLR